MQVRFHGAAGEVTGSMHEVLAAGHRLLLDCGMIQGSPEAERRNTDPFPFDPAGLDALLLSHAHIDHIGRVPLLVKRGFRGPIFAQAATADLLPIMLLDAAGIAESEAARFNRKRRRGEPEAVPVYTQQDVNATLALLRPLDYDATTEVLPGVTLTLREAGHILGSCVLELQAEGRTLVFSGDLGPRGAPILRDPATIARADLVLMESTYGDRDHRERAATVNEIGDVLESAWRARGNVMIPAFAVGRTQELLYWFARHWDEWKLERWRIFLDSPMAARVSAVYQRHQSLFDAHARETWASRISPFQLPNLHYTATTEESMAINRIQSGAIVIAGSGMANAGRIVHHLKHNLGRREAHVMFVGYQAAGTLGRRLVERAPWVRIHGRDHRVGAQIHTVGGLSAHAGQQGLIDWYGHIEGHPPLALVHGEDRAREALAGEIGERFGVCAHLARPGDTLEV
ncbi:MBL fold metallo-hydrolase RNA specificity domain-containing protein [Marilutibacter alkalisoli]|uniref:MBL fold metallo-hydrolase n=1 Tax=Marilutibacter alkalisoli TaxID=2591633 RepID=A0A514BQ40_9GAMM|nr:MBL fold metallo-hydrolase [Lysobacter alkalisoli]QDH69491.1 MBL fold metallo-hydrolase [Lysobacter alkalisoli]